MSSINFEPWIGSKYWHDNRFGVRVVVLGEAHYGDPADPGSTADVVQWFAVEEQERKPFFTKTANVLLGLERTVWADSAARRDVWAHVAFYNYIQTIVSPGPRVRPAPHLWGEAQTPFWEMLQRLGPQVLLVLGKALAWHLPLLPESIDVCRIQHPSTAFSYRQWNPLFAQAVERAKTRQRLHPTEREATP